MVSMFFGLPGCGKTTLAAKFALKAVRSKKYKNVYVNFPLNIKGVTLIQNDDFGRYNLDNGLIIIDEATIFADSRGFKDFGKQKIQYLLLHRHYNVDIMFFSQGYNAVDKKIRDLTVRLYYIQKSKFFPISKYYPIRYGIMFPDGENLGEIAEGYSKPPLLARLLTTRHFWRPKYYKYFDSWDAPDLPKLPSKGA